MWRRVSSQLRAFAPWRSSIQIHRPAAAAAASNALWSGPITVIGRTPCSYSSDSGNAPPTTNKRVEDIMPIVTGLEREELEAELQGKKRFDMDAPVGPFGTKVSD